MMMVQQVLIGVIFLIAIFYIVRMVFRNFSPSKKGCAKGCGCEGDEMVSKSKMATQLKKDIGANL